jgi:hypothetical protein
MNSSLLIFSSCLNRIRLLKTPENGATDEIVASSWIEALAGLSRWNTRKVPPAFCANAGAAANTIAAAARMVPPTMR